MSIRGRSFSHCPNNQWMTAEAKSLFSLFRDEYDKTKQMPLLKRYREMERVIEIFTAEDVLHKLLVLTREVDKDGVMLARTNNMPQNIHDHDKETDRQSSFANNFSVEKENVEIATKSQPTLISAGLPSTTSRCKEPRGERRGSDQSSHTAYTYRRQKNGILQNIIKSDEIPEFQIPPQLDIRLHRRNAGRRHTKVCLEATLNDMLLSTYETKSLPPNSYLQDSAALPGFFINTDLSLESLNIQSLYDHVTESRETDCGVPPTRSSSVINICLEKHLQDLDLASLASFSGVGSAKSPEPDRLIRIFVFKQILYLRKEYKKLKGKNALVRYRKMSELLENCAKSCAQLKM